MPAFEQAEQKSSSTKQDEGVDDSKVTITALDASLVPFDGTPPNALPTAGWLERWTKVGTLDPKAIEEMRQVESAVVDTNCLLNDVACLHLLANCMQLIIPRAVIKEIDNLMHRTASSEQDEGKHFQARISRNWMHAEMTKRSGRIQLQNMEEQAFRCSDRNADGQILSCAHFFQQRYDAKRVHDEVSSPTRCLLLTRDKILQTKAFSAGLLTGSANQVAWNCYAAGLFAPSPA